MFSYEITERNLCSRRGEYLEKMDGWPTIRAARATKFSYTLSEKVHFHEMEMEAICI